MLKSLLNAIILTSNTLPPRFLQPSPPTSSHPHPPFVLIQRAGEGGKKRGMLWFWSTPMADIREINLREFSPRFTYSMFMLKRYWVLLGFQSSFFHCVDFLHSFREKGIGIVQRKRRWKHRYFNVIYVLLWIDIKQRKTIWKTNKQTCRRKKI